MIYISFFRIGPLGALTERPFERPRGHFFWFFFLNFFSSKKRVELRKKIMDPVSESLHQQRDLPQKFFSKSLLSIRERLNSSKTSTSEIPSNVMRSVVLSMKILLDLLFLQKRDSKPPSTPSFLPKKMLPKKKELPKSRNQSM